MEILEVLVAMSRQSSNGNPIAIVAFTAVAVLIAIAISTILSEAKRPKNMLILIAIAVLGIFITNIFLKD